MSEKSPREMKRLRWEISEKRNTQHQLNRANIQLLGALQRTEKTTGGRIGKAPKFLKTERHPPKMTTTTQ